MRFNAVLLFLWLSILPSQAFALSCAFIYPHMVEEADVVAHVRVTAINPLESGVPPEYALADDPAVVSLTVARPIQGAKAGEVLFLRKGVPYLYGPNLALYPKGTEWVVFLKRAHENGGANAAPSNHVYVPTCWHFSVPVIDGRVDPQDFLRWSARSANFVRSRMALTSGSRSQGSAEASPDDDRQKRVAERRSLTVREFARVYKNPGL